MKESIDELIDFFSSECKKSPTIKNEEKLDIWKDYREKLGEEKLNEYILELKRLRELERKEMSDSPYGIPSGRGCMDVFRPLRHKYAAVQCILMGNFGLLSPEKADGWYKSHQEKYHELTGEYFDLNGIIERKY